MCSKTCIMYKYTTGGLSTSVALHITTFMPWWKIKATFMGPSLTSWVVAYNSIDEYLNLSLAKPEEHKCQNMNAGNVIITIITFPVIIEKNKHIRGKIAL